MADITQTVRLLMDARKAATEMQRVGRRFDSLNKKVSAIAKTAGIAFAATQIVQFATETAKLAAEAEGVAVAFERLNDPNLLKSLQEATKGTVNNLELMRSSVQAVQLGIDQNQLARYFEFASLRAQQTGQSVDELVSKLVLGVGRQSVLRLDDLGLSAKRLGEEAKKAGDFVKGVGVIIDEELAKGGGVAENTAVNFQQLSAEVDNLKLEIGQGLLPVYKELLLAFRDTAKVASSLGSEELSGWTKFVNILATASPQLNGYAVALQNIDKQKAATVNEATARSQEALNKAVELGLIKADEAIIKNDTLTEQQYKIIAANSALISSYTLQKNAIVDNANSLCELNKELKELAEEANLSKTAAQFAEVQTKIRGVEQQIKAIKTPMVAVVQDIPQKGVEAYKQLGTTLNGVSDAFINQRIQMSQSAAETSAAINQLTVDQEAYNQKLETANGIVSYFGQGLTDVFYSSLINGQSFFKQMGDYLKKLAARFVSAAVAAAALAVAISLIPGLGAAGAAKGLSFGNIFGQLSGLKGVIPGLAEGGIVTGPTLALIGEGKESEAVIPLSKLGQMTGGSETIIPDVRIAGEDLLIVFNRANHNKNRVG
jgi:hypothetical protein